MCSPEPQPGPLHHKMGPFIRKIQPHPNNPDLWLVEAAKGITGKAKVWRPALIIRNVDFDPSETYGWRMARFLSRAGVQTSKVSHRRGQWKVDIWSLPAILRLESYFMTQEEAVAFMLKATSL